jgi:hypothetical protein
LDVGSFVCSLPLELSRQGFRHRLVVQLENLGQFFLGRSVTGADQLHDRDRRDSGCGDELDHDLGFADVGLLDIKSRRLERAEELLDAPRQFASMNTGIKN